MQFPLTLKQLRKALLEGKTFNYTFFWDGIFSQWYQPSKFKINNIIYNSAEQYMMAEKARYFKDKTTLNKILTSVHPYEQKALGRIVKNYNDAQWSAVRSGIVIKGNLEKFRQNEELKMYLLNTEDSILVEASPKDAIWGIKMDENHPDATNPYKWQGLNLLGFCLVAVRETIKTEILNV